MRKGAIEVIYGNRCKTKPNNDYSVREDKHAIAERRNTRLVTKNLGRTLLLVELEDEQFEYLFEDEVESA